MPLVAYMTVLSQSHQSSLPQLADEQRNHLGSTDTHHCRLLLQKRWMPKPSRLATGCNHWDAVLWILFPDNISDVHPHTVPSPAFLASCEKIHWVDVKEYAVQSRTLAIPSTIHPFVFTQWPQRKKRKSFGNILDLKISTGGSSGPSAQQTSTVKWPFSRPAVLTVTVFFAFLRDVSPTRNVRSAGLHPCCRCG